MVIRPCLLRKGRDLRYIQGRMPRKRVHFWWRHPPAASCLVCLKPRSEAAPPLSEAGSLQPGRAVTTSTTETVHRHRTGSAIHDSYYHACFYHHNVSLSLYILLKHFKSIKTSAPRGASLLVVFQPQDHGFVPTMMAALLASLGVFFPSSWSQQYMDYWPIEWIVIVHILYLVFWLSFDCCIV